eukprot:gene22488-biopygen23222
MYDSFVYIDTLYTSLPGRKLEPTQALWEAGREQHLGTRYQISPMQPWYTSDVQCVHSMFMSGTVEVLDRAMIVLERPHFPIDGRVVSHKKLVCVGHAVAEQSGLLQRLLEREPTMVRGSFVMLQSWVTLLSMVTRDTVQVVESFWALLGYDVVEEWDSGSLRRRLKLPVEDVHLGQPYEGVGGIPSDDWAFGLFHPPHWSVALGDSGMPVEADVNSGMGDYCSSDWYCDIPGLEDGSDSGDEDACALHGDHPLGSSLALYVASADNTADIFTRALPLPAFSGKVALLDNGATKHIFNLVSDFGSDFDPASSSTFSVVQASIVSSVGSGTVTLAKLDVSTGHAIGLQFAGAHCIPGQPFNLVSVVALEDAGFSVDFGARQISSGGVAFSFSRVGNRGDLNVNYPLFTEVTVDAGRKEMEAGIICARAVGASSVPYCVMLLTNFTHIDLPVGKVQFPPEHTCLAAVGKACAGGSMDVLPDGVPEPKGVKQAMEAPDADEWMDAIQTELEALVTVKKALLMMDLEDVPPGVRLLDMSLVLKVKREKHRQLQNCKARVCVKGNKQEYGVDYFDTFALCTQLSSVRLIIILALNLALGGYHMDVETAFLNMTLEEDLYVKLPRGLECQGRTCAKLLKAVYGLK